MTTTLYIIRHGETAGNAAACYQGSTDCELNERGCAQIERLAECCREKPFEVIYSSPLVRARETAAAANRWHNLPLRIDPDLAEMYCGQWEGVPWSDIAARWPSEIALWREQPWLFESPGGETMRQVYERVSRALTRILQEHKGKTIAVVSHGCAIRNGLCFLHGLPLEEIGGLPWVHNTSISCAVQEDGLPIRVCYEDDFDHVSDIVKL